MRILKAVLLFIAICADILCAIILHAAGSLFFRRRRYAAIAGLTRCFSILAVKILGVKVSIEGGREIKRAAARCIVSNHLGYLDGIVLASVFAALFVSKRAVSRWPLFGWMTRLGGTVFIDRGRRLESAKTVQQIAGLLGQGIDILLFPEGTSTDGSRVLPFQSIFFQSAIDAKADILPVTIRYTSFDGKAISRENRDRIHWYGQVSFGRHLLGLLSARRIEATLTVHPAIPSGTVCERKKLADLAREAIIGSFSSVA